MIGADSGKTYGFSGFWAPFAWFFMKVERSSFLGGFFSKRRLSAPRRIWTIRSCRDGKLGGPTSVEAIWGSSSSLPVKSTAVGIGTDLEPWSPEVLLGSVLILNWESCAITRPSFVSSLPLDKAVDTSDDPDPGGGWLAINLMGPYQTLKLETLETSFLDQTRIISLRIIRSTAPFFEDPTILPGPALDLRELLVLGLGGPSHQTPKPRNLGFSLEWFVRIK